MSSEHNNNVRTVELEKEQYYTITNKQVKGKRLLRGHKNKTRVLSTDKGTVLPLVSCNETAQKIIDIIPTTVPLYVNAT